MAATNPHVYVSSIHGTNTGTSDTSFASQQTGAMTALTASDVYDNLGSAIAGCDPSDGQVIYVADDHAAAYDNAGDVPINPSSTPGGSGLKIVSVAAANINQYSPGASEHLTDPDDDYLFEGNILIAGVSLETGDNVLASSWGSGTIRLTDLTITTDTTGDAGFFPNHDGIEALFTNVNILGNSGSCIALKMQSGAKLTWYGGSVNEFIGKLLDFSPAVNGGAEINLVGVDLSAYTGILAQTADAASVDVYTTRLFNCRLNAAATLHGTFASTMHRFEMFNCDDSTGGDFHRFYIHTGAGTAKNNDATYVTATKTWYEGAVKSSIEVLTESLCSHITPFIFDLPAQYVDLSQTASDVLTLELTTETALTLTDTDIAAFFVYPDGTTSVIPRWLTSGKSDGSAIDPIGAGATLATGSLGAADWTGEDATSPNFYKLVLDTSGTPGGATAVSVRIEVYKASIAAGTLFIHPLLILS